MTKPVVSDLDVNGHSTDARLRRADAGDTIDSLLAKGEATMPRKMQNPPRWFVGASLAASLGVSAVGCSSTTAVDSGIPDVASDEPRTYYGPIQVDTGTPADVASDEPRTFYGPIQVDSGTPTDTPSDEPLAYYGPVQVDTGTPTDATTDEPLVFYGPVLVDS